MKIIVLALIVCLGRLSSSLLFSKTDPEVYMNITEAIRYYGYPCENHDVITEDGYILTMQRIRHGKINGGDNETRPVALLQHGLLDSSHTWVFNRPDQSLGFILADAGFDVWLANSRGTTYSTRHVRLSVKSKEFWDFSIDEMAEYDLPASIRYALSISEASTLSFVGHSQGSLIAFAKFSSDKEVARLVSSFVALGPVTTVKYIGFIPQITIKSISTFAPVLNFISNGEFLPTSNLIKMVANTVCTKDIFTPVCYNPIFWLAGFDISNLNKTRLPVIVGHTPAGTSVKNLVHYNQLLSSGNCQMFDYGSEKKNKYRYGTRSPPLYDVTQLTVPLSMYWGGKDILANPTDVKNLIPRVYKSLKHHKYIPYYNHMDYIWGIDASKVIYKEAIDFMRVMHGMSNTT